MKDIKDLLAAIEKSMYGKNFEVKLGIDVFEGNSLAEIEKAIEQRYTKINPVNLRSLAELDKEEFTKDIREKLNYRGDETAGLILSKKQEEKLQILFSQYFDILASFENSCTKYHYFTDLEGLPCYPVFWDFGFVLFTDNKKIILVYGAASD
ncbi:hypothetical protein [Pedobacter helvus]|uniref:Knr4/Smi1-like domain-containing protein n=1 Tax=Pedobacter helvus TaxID=2563444 RepID=A0ABW9JFC1_9SPHI|nr:hypothetical protein [Pedobacter ureilyticus]